jgi:pyridoxamine 5'-phosphate oxidase
VAAEGDRSAGFDDLDPDPFAQLTAWLEDARGSGLLDPWAMALATVSPDGWPSSRMVLLRGVDPRGLVFYTDYGSPKAADVTADPRAAVTFFWDPLHRQVRVTGRVERVSAEESDAYFASRPRGHQLSAWASEQSRPIADRAGLEARAREVEERFASVEGSLPRPERWGGFRLVPATFEFWHGRQDRLHDRLRYERDPEGEWRRQRLMP